MSLLLLLGGVAGGVAPPLGPVGFIEGDGRASVTEAGEQGHSIEGHSTFGRSLIEGQAGTGG
jgi:hypothetical protein